MPGSGRDNDYLLILLCLSHAVMNVVPWDSVLRNGIQIACYFNPSVMSWWLFSVNTYICNSSPR